MNNSKSVLTKKKILVYYENYVVRRSLLFRDLTFKEVHVICFTVKFFKDRKLKCYSVNIFKTLKLKRISAEGFQFDVIQHLMLL